MKEAVRNPNEKKNANTGYKLSVSYSWGDSEPDQFFDSETEAWNTAKTMAGEEADNTLMETEDDQISLRIFYQKKRIVLEYPYQDGSVCTYQVSAVV